MFSLSGACDIYTGPLGDPRSLGGPGSPFYLGSPDALSSLLSPAGPEDPKLASSLFGSFGPQYLTDPFFKSHYPYLKLHR